MTPRIGPACDRYLREVVPASAGPTQIVETRRAFYAGAMALLELMLAGLEDTDLSIEPTEAELHMMDEIAAELVAFAASSN